MKRVRLTVAIPAYNEESGISTTLEKIIQVLNLAKFTSYEIIVIDDGSTDKTRDQVEKIQNTFGKVRLLGHITNLGRGMAVRTAMKNFRGDVLIVLDADLSYSAEVALELATPILNGLADLTLASPYSDGGEVRNVPFLRYLISKSGNRVLRSAFRYPRATSTSIARGYSRKLVHTLSLISSGKELNLEVLYKAELLGFRVLEIPSILSWPQSRKAREKESKIRKYFSLGKVIKTHLLFQFMARPGLLFGIPILISFIVCISGITMLSLVFVDNLVIGVANPLRETFAQGTITFAVTLFSFIVALLFSVIYFLVVQSKLFFEDLFIFISNLQSNSKIEDKNYSDRN